MWQSPGNPSLVVTRSVACAAGQDAPGGFQLHSRTNLPPTSPQLPCSPDRIGKPTDGCPGLLRRVIPPDFAGYRASLRDGQSWSYLMQRSPLRPCETSRR